MLKRAKITGDYNMILEIKEAYPLPHNPKGNQTTKTDWLGNVYTNDASQY